MDFPSVIVFIAWLLGGFVSGLTGIGGAMLAVPLAAMFIPMHDVILLSCILNLAMDGTLTCMYLRHCRFSALAPLLAGAIPGAFIVKSGLVCKIAFRGTTGDGRLGGHHPLLLVRDFHSLASFDFSVDGIEQHE